MARRGKPDFRGGSGEMNQAEIFGEVNLLTFQEYLDNKPEHMRVPYSEALRAVRENQPFDVHDPDPRFASDLHATVAEKLVAELGGEFPYMLDQLSFYTAIHSILDYRYGVDAFFEFTDPESEQTIRITLDAATYDKGDVSADVMIVYQSLDLDDPEDKRKWQELIDQHSDEVVKVILSQIRKEVQYV